MFESYQDIANFLGVPIYILLAVIVWSMIWKGFALWKSARRNSLYWFVAILVINTLGILDILYIYIFSKTKKVTSRISKTNVSKRKR